MLSTYMIDGVGMVGDDVDRYRYDNWKILSSNWICDYFEQLLFTGVQRGEVDQACPVSILQELMCPC